MMDFSKSHGFSQAWVVFCDAPHVPYLRLFKPGFRHCFVVLRASARWVTIDPLLGQMDIMIHSASRQNDLISYMKESGLTPVLTDINFVKHKKFALSLCTCVGIVKQIIGVQKKGILTPYQLYSYLKSREAMAIEWSASRPSKKGDQK